MLLVLLGGSCAAGELGEDGVGVVDAASPDASAGLDEGGPEAGVVGQVGVGGEVGAGRAGGETAGAFFGGRSSSPASPTRSTVPWRAVRSMTISMGSPSRMRPMGPPARASGEMWPMQAPVETPLKRASVRTATCLQKGRALSAEVTW